MDDSKKYTLPALSFEYGALAPFITEKQLTLHHQKHHQAYVTGANAIFEKLEKARSLLISTSLSINEISQMCGYPSLQYFYSVFRKEYDTTPKEYRDRHSEVLI